LSASGVSGPAGLEAVDAPAGFSYQTEAGAVSSGPLPVSFFVRPESRFFVPTRAGARTPRADAVKAGRRGALAASSPAARPRLDGGEHGVTLGQVGAATVARSSARQRGVTPIDYAHFDLRGARGRGGEPWPHNLVFGESQMSDSTCRIRTMMQSCASAAGSSAAGPFYRSGTTARVGFGSPPPRISGRSTGIADRRLTLLSQSPSRSDAGGAGIIAPGIVRPP
jgi:hypothetical protein